MSPISDAVIKYRNLQMGAVSVFSDTTSSVLEETAFFDAGYIESTTKRIQRSLKSKKAELSTNIEMDKQDSYYIEKRKELQDDTLRLTYRLMFIGSNDVRVLQDCEKIAEEQGFDFAQCIKGMRAYYEGDKDRAFELIEPYYIENGAVENHFLINKVFGMLLMEKGKFDKSIPFLSYALQYNPDDMECLNAVKKCLENTRDVEHVKFIDQAIEMLEWRWN